MPEELTKGELVSSREPTVGFVKTVSPLHIFLFKHVSFLSAGNYIDGKNMYCQIIMHIMRIIEMR